MTSSNDSQQGTAAPKGSPSDAGSDDIQYESAAKPLLWLLIPFIMVLMYGIFSN